MKIADSSATVWFGRWRTLESVVPSFACMSKNMPKARFYWLRMAVVGMTDGTPQRARLPGENALRLPS
jgi:hypothetical protein